MKESSSMLSIAQEYRIRTERLIIVSFIIIIIANTIEIRTSMHMYNTCTLIILYTYVYIGYYIRMFTLSM